MQSNYSLFTRYTPYNPPIEVKLANNHIVFAPGYGVIKLVLHDGKRWVPFELSFLHVPDLRCMLISVSALASEGIFFKTNPDGGWIHCLDGTTIGRVDCSAGLYYLRARYEGSHAAFATRSAKSKPLSLATWHASMGHASNSTLRKAEKVVLGLIINDDGQDQLMDEGEHIDCLSCIMGKQKWFPFPLHARCRATYAAELIHMDVWGPVNTTTPSGETYFVAFTDDFS